MNKINQKITLNSRSKADFFISFQTQLIYRDNSQSETIIEVKLRHPGENDRNIVCFIILVSNYYFNNGYTL